MLNIGGELSGIAKRLIAIAGTDRIPAAGILRGHDLIVARPPWNGSDPGEPMMATVPDRLAGEDGSRSAIWVEQRDGRSRHEKRDCP
jgi:hypothetical protein